METTNILHVHSLKGFLEGEGSYGKNLDFWTSLGKKGFGKATQPKIWQSIHMFFLNLYMFLDVFEPKNNNVNSLKTKNKNVNSLNKK